MRALQAISYNQHVAGLSTDDRFKLNVESRFSVSNYLDKSIEIYKKNLDIGLKQNLQNPWIDTSGTRVPRGFCFQRPGSGKNWHQLFLDAPLPDGGSVEELRNKPVNSNFKQA